MDKRILDIKLRYALYPHIAINSSIAQEINRCSVRRSVGALGGIDYNGELILAVSQQVGDVLTEPRKTALVSKRGFFVDKYRSTAHDTVKVKNDSLALHLVGNDKELAVLHDFALILAGVIAVFGCTAVVGNVHRTKGSVKVFVFALFRGIIGCISPPVVEPCPES